MEKALYDLKQAPRAWNKRIDAFFFLSQLGFTKCSIEHGIYVKAKTDVDLMVVCLYVDDLLITGSDQREVEEIKRQMKAEFDMIDLRKLTYFLGLEFVQTEKRIILH